MSRVFVVDPSPTRSVLARVRSLHERTERFADCAAAAERALATPPRLLVAPALCPGINGAQISRLLAAEASTADLPVILYGDRDDRGIRFWSKRAGARAYVTLGVADALETAVREALLLPHLASDFFVQLDVGEGVVATRLASQLDMALFESTVASEVRLLAGAASLDEAFSGLISFVDQTADLAYIAMVIDAAKWRAARGTTPLGASTYRYTLTVGSDRIGELECAAPTKLDRECDARMRRILSTIARELGVPFRAVSLFEQQRRLERRVRRTEKLEAMRSLTAKLAHEINTPLQYATTDTAFLLECASEIRELVRRYRSGVVGDAAEKDVDVDFLLENLPSAAQSSAHALSQIADAVRALQRLVRDQERLEGVDEGSLVIDEV